MVYYVQRIIGLSLDRIVATPGVNKSLILLEPRLVAWSKAKKDYSVSEEKECAYIHIL